MILILAIITATAWVVSFFILHVASSAVHSLLILAIIGVVAHLVRGSASTNTPVGRLGEPPPRRVRRARSLRA